MSISQSLGQIELAFYPMEAANDEYQNLHQKWNFKYFKTQT